MNVNSLAPSCEGSVEAEVRSFTRDPGMGKVSIQGGGNLSREFKWVRNHRNSMKQLTQAGLILFLAVSSSAQGAPSLAPSPVPSGTAPPSAARKVPETAPAIASLLRKEHLSKLLEEREILTSATLSDLEAPLKRYSFFAAMLVRATPALTHKTLTDYAVYARLVPYVDRSAFDPASRVLEVEGGIWKFKLRSWLQFEEKGKNWIPYRIIRGHFSGLSGEILFESQGEKGTLVHLRGTHVDSRWPPKFILERGAEIVFGFTARRMRSYIEAQKNPTPGPKENGNGNSNDTEVPRPRTRLNSSS